MRNQDGSIRGTIPAKEKSREGGLGWLVGGCASRDGSTMMTWADVCQLYDRAVEGETWRGMMRAATAPSVIGFGNGYPDAAPGSVKGAWDAGFGGAGANVRWAVMIDRVIRSTDGINFVDTAITGLPVEANNGTRMYQGKGATDPINADVYHIAMGSHGSRLTLDGGLTVAAITGLPAPSSPAKAVDRYTLYALDENGPDIAGRKARIAACPCGQGVRLSEDGGITYTDISAGGPLAVSDMLWHANALYVLAVDPVNPGLIIPNNLRRWTAAGGWEAIDNRDAADQTATWQHVIRDPRQPHALLFVHASQSYSYCPDITAADPVFAHWYVKAPGHGASKTKPRRRPIVAKKIRRQGTGGAPARPFVAGRWLMQPHGLGISRTLLADFPTAGSTYSDERWSAKLPTLEEDCAGIEETVGLNTAWAGDVLWCGGQDNAIQRFHERADSFEGGAYRYHDGLSDANQISVCLSNPDYAVAKINRTNPNNATPAFSYTANRRHWQAMPNQPLQSGSATFESGSCLAGPPGLAFVFPAYDDNVAGDQRAEPQYTDDLGATPWKPMRFYREDGSELDIAGVTWDGFRGMDFSNTKEIAVADPADPTTFYCVNTGGGSGANDATSWQFDPLDHGGIYRSTAANPGRWDRVMRGNPWPQGNRGLWSGKLRADGQGHLVWIQGYMGNDGRAQGVHPVVIDMATWTKRTLARITNCISIDFGAPYPGDPNPCLWMLGWTPESAPGARDGVYAIYYSRDLLATPPVFYADSVDPIGGFINHISAHKTRWGLLGYSAGSTGHGRIHPPRSVIPA